MDNTHYVRNTTLQAVEILVLYYILRSTQNKAGVVILSLLCLAYVTIRAIGIGISNHIVFSSSIKWDSDLSGLMKLITSRDAADFKKYKPYFNTDQLRLVLQSIFIAILYFICFYRLWATF